MDWNNPHEIAAEMQRIFVDSGPHRITQIRYSENDGWSIDVQSESELFPDKWEIYTILAHNGPNAKTRMGFQSLDYS